jgi:precorrin-2 C(20)-methyltransferase
MNHEIPGRFWAVGVGPGDPDLLTLKAARLIQKAGAIYHAGPAPNQGRAWDIVAPLVRDHVPVHCVLSVPMADIEMAHWRDAYRSGVERILADLQNGTDVVFVTEGDPTLYSTAACVWQFLAEMAADAWIEVVPGVTSITAAAARAAWPLAQKDEPLAIVPTDYHAGNLAYWLAEFPSVCFLKPARSLPELTDALKSCDAVYVENVGTNKERVTRDLSDVADRHQYFSLVLARRKAQPTAAGVVVVGLGPGGVEHLTAAARTALSSADVVVGYDSYLRSLAPLRLRAEMVGSPIGAESDRARQALAFAQNGKRVALVSSGDAGVYGMASLLLETTAEAPEVAVEVVPGVTAALAAAALLGAPLGHDWACVSLSDLLTPWETIESRLHAAGRCDFVVVLYNPISERRTWQLPRAAEILRQYRSGETPVGLVEKASRPGQRVGLTTLGTLTTDGVTMETALIIGSSQTRVIHGRMVTPRGYQARGEERGTRDERGRGSRSLVSLPPSLVPRPSPLAPPSSILDESFAIIERELGPHSFPPWTFAVVRRLIHATADFEFAANIRYSAEAADVFRRAVDTGLVVVTDTEMVAEGVRTAVGRLPGARLFCHLNDPETRDLANSAGLTRSAAGMRIAAGKHSAPVLVIGNAPTALEEALRLIESARWRPALLIGMPVGFVGVLEAKARLLKQVDVPYLTCVGRKGGSAAAAAAFNALAETKRRGQQSGETAGLQG